MINDVWIRLEERERGITYATLNLGQNVAEITNDMGLPVKPPNVTFRYQLKALYRRRWEKKPRDHPWAPRKHNYPVFFSQILYSSA